MRRRLLALVPAAILGGCSVHQSPESFDWWLLGIVVAAVGLGVLIYTARK